MSENARQEVVTQKPRMAICYDFDKTLSPDDMQSFTLIPSLGMRPEDFLARVQSTCKRQPYGQQSRLDVSACCQV